MKKWYEVVKRPYEFNKTIPKRNIFQLILHIISDYHLPANYHEERLKEIVGG